MSNLSNSIFDYYRAGLSQLPLDKQFHFASRLHLWQQQAGMQDELRRLSPWFTADEQPHEALQRIIQQALSQPDYGFKNAAGLRQAHWQRYPKLKLYTLLLFRITFLKTIYDIDCRKAFLELFPKAEIEALVKELLADTEALAILSTNAVNFLYLYKRIICEDETALPLERFLTVGRTAYDYRDKTHLQLYIYLYTHCIIGDTQFYYRNLPAAQLPIYQVMITELEALIDKRFEDINLDNKCEFLVCAAIVGHHSKLADRIAAEAAQSVSDAGVFLIDRHNHNPQTEKESFDESEHRNVLFIMSNRPFTPTG
jgi:hypothetical protein